MANIELNSLFIFLPKSLLAAERKLLGKIPWSQVRQITALKTATFSQAFPHKKLRDNALEDIHLRDSYNSFTGAMFSSQQWICWSKGT